MWARGGRRYAPGVPRHNRLPSSFRCVMCITAPACAMLAQRHPALASVATCLMARQRGWTRHYRSLCAKDGLAACTGLEVDGMPRRICCTALVLALRKTCACVLNFQKVGALVAERTALVARSRCRIEKAQPYFYSCLCGRSAVALYQQAYSSTSVSDLVLTFSTSYLTSTYPVQQCQASSRDTDCTAVRGMS